MERERFSGLACLKATLLPSRVSLFCSNSSSFSKDKSSSSSSCKLISEKAKGSESSCRGSVVSSATILDEEAEGDSTILTGLEYPCCIMIRDRLPKDIAIRFMECRAPNKKLI